MILLRIPQPNLQRKVEFLAMKRINLEENNNDDCINNLLFKLNITDPNCIIELGPFISHALPFASSFDDASNESFKVRSVMILFDPVMLLNSGL